MGNKEQKAYSEILAFLKIIDEEYLNKVPKKLIEIFEQEKLENYCPKYSLETPIEEQNFTSETLEIIAMLYLNYWCENEEEKSELIKMYNQNDLIKEQDLNEKYNIDNIFNKKQKEDSNEVQELSLVEYKESFFKRILDKIKKIFKIINN